MKRAANIFTDEKRLQVNRAVAAAESSCAAEFVPVVADASGRYDRAEDLFGGCVAAIAFMGAWMLFQREDPSAGGWDGLPLTLQLPALLAILIVAFVAGAVLAAAVPALRRPFHSRSEMKKNVAASAAQAAFDQRVHHAPSDAGVVIFVSLYEKLAVVMADDIVMNAIGQDGLDAVASKLIEGLRKGDAVSAICDAVIDARDRLKDDLPATAQSRRENELPDALVVL